MKSNDTFFTVRRGFNPPEKPTEPQATSDYRKLVEPLLATENSSGALSSATRTNKITS
jgi:hypothetical protein